MPRCTSFRARTYNSNQFVEHIVVGFRRAAALTLRSSLNKLGTQVASFTFDRGRDVEISKVP